MACLWVVLLPHVLGQCTVLELNSPGDVGTLTSPNYPLQYPTNQNLCWLIQTSSSLEGSTYKVVLQVEDSLLEKNGYCSYDYVSVRVGGVTVDHVLKTWCGEENPGLLISPGSSMYVFFKSDTSFSFRGFKATYSIVYSPEVGYGVGTRYNNSDCTAYQIAMRNTSYVLTTPNYPQNYDTDTQKCWILYVSPSLPAYAEYQITFKVTSSRLETSTTCQYDRAIVRDGDNSAAPLINQWCGTTVPPSMTSCGDVMYVSFSSDRTVTFPGFQAIFSAEHNSTVKKCGALQTTPDSSKLNYVTAICVSSAIAVLACVFFGCFLVKQKHKPERRVHPPRGGPCGRAHRGRVSSAWSPDGDRGMSPPPPYPGLPPDIFFTSRSRTTPSTDHMTFRDSEGQTMCPDYALPSYEETIARFGASPLQQQQQQQHGTATVQPLSANAPTLSALVRDSNSPPVRRSAQSRSSGVTLDISREPARAPPGAILLSPRTEEANQRAIEDNFLLPPGEEVASAPPSPAIYRSPTPRGVPPGVRGQNNTVTLRTNPGSGESRA